MPRRIRLSNDQGRLGYPVRTSCKILSIILPIAFLVLCSFASAQPNQTKSGDAEYYKKRGLVHLEKRQYNSAILNFSKAIKANPDDPGPYFDRGRAYGEQGQYDLAISDYTEALKINPSLADVYFYRGLIYHAKGLYDQAIFDYVRAIEINPDDAGIYYARGVTYYVKKAYDKSWADVKKAQKLGYPIHPVFLDCLENACRR